MHRSLLRRQEPIKYISATPHFSDFWHSCVNTPSFVGPNRSLAKVNAVASALATVEHRASNGEVGSVMPTRHDAVLLATLAARQKSIPMVVAGGGATSSTGADAGASATNNPNGNNGSLSLHLPEFIYRRKTKEISQEADKIYNAYMEYFNHIKFRNGWEQPIFAKEDGLATEMLHEAADICARIRARLDEENPSTKLRQADGSVQLFFNSPECGKLFNAAKAESGANDGAENPAKISQFQRREFVKTVVFNNFKDAMGFVEGLNKSKLEKYFADISDFGFNPSAHMQHLLLEMLASAEVARMSFDIADAVKYDHDSYGIVTSENTVVAPTFVVGGAAADATAVSPPSVSKRALDSARQSRDNAHFCEEDGPEDKLWRDAIGKLYKAHDALLLAVAERKKNALKGVRVE